MGEVENYGADSEAWKFLQIDEDTQGYGELQRPPDVDVSKTFTKEQILRERNGKNPRNFSQFSK